jgi:hypothetical protein
MKYFDFDGLEHKAELLDVFLLVFLVYIVIFTVSWVYNRIAS